MKSIRVMLFVSLGLLCFSYSALSQNLEKDAKHKMTELKKLITKAEKKDIDVQKEKMTLRTAEVFLNYAAWDEAHQHENVKLFKMVKTYKDSAQQSAKMLPDFERSDVNKMLDTATSYIKKLIKGEFTRTSSPLVDWSKANVKEDHIEYNGRPVFLADYSWKPEVPKLMEYYGQQDGFFLTPSYVIKPDGTIKPNVINELKNKPSGRLGFIFLNHKNTSPWMKQKYGNDFVISGESNYTAYDIDNPGAREMEGYLLDATVPLMKGKKYSELGYMLCNEPHFYTTRTTKKIDWASGPVSNYTFAKFKKYLAAKHHSITRLNKLWHTDFASFKDVKIDIPININKQGTPMWYDWIYFNQQRVTAWYTWMKGRIRKNDTSAKVHLKLIPHLWSDNKRGHGINLEDLTALSDIAGNDAKAMNSQTWGKPKEWTKHYAFDWRGMSMSYDFMKSVSPNKMCYNTEAHYLSSVHSRDLFLNPAHARATQWLSTTQGLDVSQIWYWARNADGSAMKKGSKGYIGSNNQQPRVTNEIHSTLIDLNAFSEDILAMQRQKKPIRIFHSETSAINMPEHMDAEFNVYKSLFFNGIPLGFATEKIINKQNNKDWACIIVSNTPYVTNGEMTALQSYLNNGGTVIIDSKSLKYNEYGEARSQILNAGNGKLIQSEAVKVMANKAMSLVEAKGLSPEISIKEDNPQGIKTCTWKCIKDSKGNNVLSIVNVGKTPSKLTITMKGAKKAITCMDLINGVKTSSTPTLKPDEVYFVKVIN